MSIFFSDSYLKKCADLGAILPPTEFGPGDFAARGFADLGVEVFCIIGAGRMISAFSGHISDAPSASDRNFFRVLDADELINELSRLGADLAKIEFMEQRLWSVEVNIKGEAIRQEAGSLHEVLIDCLLRVVEVRG